MAISELTKQEIHEAVHKQWQIYGLQTPVAFAKTIIAALEIYDAAGLQEELGKLRAENAELKRQVSQLRQMLNE